MSEHTEHITTSCHTYQIHLAGTMDGTNTRDPVGYGNYSQSFESNIQVRLENVGQTPVRNPRIIVNGKRNWHSLEAILDEILVDGMSDAEKARAIWEFARRHRYHFTTADDEVKDTVKMLNCYGYTLCWDEAYTVSNLWQAAGLKIRRGIPHGHCTTEVFFDGAFHLLDSDEHLLILQRDNQTIASEAEMARDHDLMKRTHAYGILSPESRRTSEQAASLFVHDGPRSGGRPLIGNHCMDVELRPGEALIWEWGSRGKYHGYGDPPPRLCNGRLQYIPDLGRHFTRWAAESINLEAADSGLQPLDPGQESRLSYRLESPYVMVGGKVNLTLAGSGARLEISADGNSWEKAATLGRAGDHCVDLDSHFPSAAPATYSYYLRLCTTGGHLAHLLIETDLQMAPLSCRPLKWGPMTSPIPTALPPRARCKSPTTGRSATMSGRRRPRPPRSFPTPAAQSPAPASNLPGRASRMPPTITFSFHPPRICATVCRPLSTN